MSIYQDISRNYLFVKSQIEQAALKAERNPENVKLVVVTKAQPLDKIKAVVDLGAHHLGENHVEEALPKMSALSEYHDIHWHMIGHVQSRKAKYVMEGFHLIHSLDSQKLADIYDRLAGDQGSALPVLLEMNSGGEETKYGWDISRAVLIGDVIQKVDEIMKLPNLAVRGLMTMAPLVTSNDETRRNYRRMKRVLVDLRAKYPTRDIIELSMGTSADYAIAVEEGATYIRVGQAIMGQRS
ncbi:MAG: YggS family pyridoxal phosphate-dependent enzyme [Anaerolineaceae bacterium]